MRRRPAGRRNRRWTHHPAVAGRDHRTGAVRPSEREGARPGEAGTGIIATTAGVSVFLILLLVAVQLSVNLLATSTVSAAGYDAARSVASRRVDHTSPGSVAAAQQDAESMFHRIVGRAATDARFLWQLDATSVRLRILMRPPGILPRSLGASVGMDDIDRTFVVRIEELR